MRDLEVDQQRTRTGLSAAAPCSRLDGLLIRNHSVGSHAWCIRGHVGLGYHAGMSGAPGGSAGSGHGSDPDEEALLRRIREFLRHGTAAEAGVEEWGEFVAQLRFLREELPLEERRALLERWDRVLSRALPDLTECLDRGYLAEPRGTSRVIDRLQQLQPIGPIAAKT